MNKIKIMLTAVVVMATVGGALAIKSKRINPLCTAAVKADGTCGNGSAQNPWQLCAGSIANRRSTTDDTAPLRCTAAVNPMGTQCPSNKECRVSTFITVD